MIPLTWKQTFIWGGLILLAVLLNCHGRAVFGQVRVKQESVIVDRDDLVAALRAAKERRRRAWAHYLALNAEVAAAQTALNDFDAVVDTLPTPGPTVAPTSTPGHTPSPTGGR